MTDEGVLDPWVADWLKTNALRIPLKDILDLARPKEAAAPVRELAHVEDEVADGVPVRLYRPDERPTGLIVYFHGGAFCVGSVALMDNVARELVHACGAVVVSAEYRLAPERPFPAGLDDCETVTRWAVANAPRFDVSPAKVIVAGESAGGNLAAAVTLRLRDEAPLAGQVLIYPVVDHGLADHPSREFLSLTMAEEDWKWVWNAYTGGQNLDDNPFAVPLRAESLAGLPPAFIVLGGCDFLRDEGRLYATRLRESGVATEEVCYPGQIHGFMNHMFPAATDAYSQLGTWVRAMCNRSEA